MKCPKCGYLGFETGDRCRNCGYDFSLTAPPTDAELTLNQPNGAENPLADLDLPAAVKPADRAVQPLDLDRLFGVEAPPPSTPAGAAAAGSVVRAAEPDQGEPVVVAVAAAAGDASILPFDEEASVRPPRPARPPLGVRRTTPESPRGRPRPNRPTRFESSPDPVLESTAPEAAPEPPVVSPVAAPPATPMEPATLPVRLSALAIDTVLLGAVSLLVLVLTLRIAGLAMTWEDIRVLPPVPFGAFLALLSLGYIAAFTVAGGQTIGKMLTGARVIGDDGRPVDAAGAVLRALGCALVPLTIGLSYGPVLLGIERRALHDRLAGTRVIRA
jgi:uncharacterized RDD family membrane protein YckC